LGNAFTGVRNNVATIAYNPAAPATLSQGSASFMFQRGLIEDSYGQFILGMPNAERTGGFGLSAGYYNAGTLDLVNDNGVMTSVKAQEDLMGALTYAHNIGNFSIGSSFKYLHSTLAQQYSASAMAVDAGILTQVSDRLSLGVSALNYGSKITYLSEGDRLPSSLNVGGSFALFPKFGSNLLFSASYMNNEKQLTPALGLETLVGPLALRAGYRKTTGNTGEFTAGAGFSMGRSSLDYAFGLINQLNYQHKVSVAFNFGPSAAMAPTMIVRPIERPRVRKVVVVKKTAEPAQEQQAEHVAYVPPAVERTVSEVPTRAHSLGGDTVLRAPRQTRRVYVVKEGDTLASIAQDELGDKRQWKTIYSANQHLIDDPTAIEVGMRIVIPMTSDNQ
jgi:hypothetical protein